MTLDPEKMAEAVAEAIRIAITPLRQRIAALEARGPVEYRGVYTEGATYQEGALVTRRGGLWLCLRANTTTAPGSDPAFWKLIVKSGDAA